MTKEDAPCFGNNEDLKELEGKPFLLFCVSSYFHFVPMYLTIANNFISPGGLDIDTL